MTLAEKQCILCARTYNPSFNSFAAEVIYHAEIANQGGIFGFLKYSNAIKADMGIGDSDGFFSSMPVPDYKDSDGEYVKRVRAIWGEQ